MTSRELGGAFGDWGTLVPFIIGYVNIVGFNPAGIFLCLGLTNIILGIRFNLPLPVQPQKTIGAVALSKNWTTSRVISTGFAIGVIWLVLGFSKKLTNIVKKVPIITVKGIQLGLGLILGWKAIELLQVDYIIGIISIVIIFLFIKIKKIPVALILTLFGIGMIISSGNLAFEDVIFSLPKINIYIPSWNEMLLGMLYAGIGQLFLTLTNVMIATIVLIKDLFPEEPEKHLEANILALNMGVINSITPFFGGIPLCHGSGGLASQYAFGARTGGSMIMEGILEIVLGVFFSSTLFTIFTSFPQAILGAMLLYTSTILGKMAFKNFSRKDLFIIIPTAILSFWINISIGFLVGLILYHLLRNKFLKF